MVDGIHLGTNGTLSDESVNAFFTALATVPRVVVLTVRAPGKSWIDGNNAKIVALPAQFPNVSVLYWDGLAGQCQGNCFYDDGIHLRQAGQDYYTALIQSQLAAGLAAADGGSMSTSSRSAGRSRVRSRRRPFRSTGTREYARAP